MPPKEVFHVGEAALERNIQELVGRNFGPTGWGTYSLYKRYSCRPDVISETFHNTLQKADGLNISETPHCSLAHRGVGVALTTSAKGIASQVINLDAKLNLMSVSFHTKSGKAFLEIFGDEVMDLISDSNPAFSKGLWQFIQGLADPLKPPDQFELASIYDPPPPSDPRNRRDVRQHHYLYMDPKNSEIFHSLTYNKDVTLEPIVMDAWVRNVHLTFGRADLIGGYHGVVPVTSDSTMTTTLGKRCPTTERLELKTHFAA